MPNLKVKPMPKWKENSVRSKRVLIVDDDREFAESIAMRCKTRGWEAEVACTPLCAIVSMTTCPPDLLCLDVNMPTGNGLDLCEYLVRDSAEPRTPVIILTGQANRETFQRAKIFRTRFVIKSTNVWQQLEWAIEELLGEYLTCDELTLLTDPNNKV
jgi:CheY-like chemotaxis protein